MRQGFGSGPAGDRTRHRRQRRPPQVAVHDQLIANRFVPIETTPAGIKARDQDTAQTVLLVDVRNLDPRIAGIFHPALITVFTIVEYAGRCLAATEFVQGRSLKVLFGGEPCHPRRAAEIVSELADGVAELHARGLALHRPR